LGEIVVAAATVAGVPAADKSFEAARQATAQRAATTLTAVDASNTTASGVNTGAMTRRVGDHTFVLANGIWRDSRLPVNTIDSSRVVVRVQAFSPAYFGVLEIVPSLKPALALGDHVIVAGRGVVLEVGPTGSTTLDPRDADALRAGWR
jgi:hypothetical protein